MTFEFVKVSLQIPQVVARGRKLRHGLHVSLDNTAGLAKTFNEEVGGFGVVSGSESKLGSQRVGLNFSIGDRESLR